MAMYGSSVGYVSDNLLTSNFLESHGHDSAPWAGSSNPQIFGFCKPKIRPQLTFAPNRRLFQATRLPNS